MMMAVAPTAVRPPLDGISVVDFSELLPGPFFTQSLAEMGARVLKVERPPGGDNARHLGPGVFEAVNRGKQSLMADLKNPQQREQVRALVAQADVLVESFRPGTMARLGLDATTLCTAYPRLIYVSLSGYGQDGPWANLPGHDVNYLAAAGVLAVSGSLEGGPVQSVGLPVADLCGAMYALSSTLAALLQRQHTGRGQHLDVSLTDCAMHWLNPRLGTYREAGAVSIAAQRELALVRPAYGVFLCCDGRHISVAALEDHFWLRLCHALDLSPFDGEAHRAIHARKAVAAAINARIAEVMAGLDSRAAFALLQNHDVPVAPVVHPGELQTLAQFARRATFEDGAVLPFVRYPVPMTGITAGTLGPAPRLDSTSIFDPARDA